MELNFFNTFSKNTEISNFMKIRPVRSVLFNVDRWTDITKLIVDFHNSVNARKKSCFTILKKPAAFHILHIVCLKWWYPCTVPNYMVSCHRRLMLMLQ